MATFVSILNGPQSQQAASHLDPNLLQQLDSLYAFYHRQWWCNREMFYYYKRCRTILNALALLIMAAGMVVGPVFKNSVAATCITAIGMSSRDGMTLKNFLSKWTCLNSLTPLMPRLCQN